jgi:Rrf2 family transcriptional regulator, iron-sulfur cluster assembly transcription factor
VRLEITRRAELAVRAMVALAETDRAAAVRGGPARLKGVELADRLGTTPAFCGQVVTPLVRAGWVRSDPGPTGGYGLGAPLSGLSVLDVIEVVDGPTDDGRCVVQNAACDEAAPCLLHRAWQLGRGELRRVLAEVSVASLMQPLDAATVVVARGG